MQFTKRLRDGVRRGEITCSVRIWTHPHVKPGGRYRLGDGAIEVDSIKPIAWEDITPALAHESGFRSVVDMLKVAKHGRGRNVYLVRFHYVPDGAPRAAGTGKKSKTSSARQRKRIVAIVGRMPETTVTAHGEHLSLDVCNKRFGWLLVDHHRDGRVALNCKASAEMHDVLKQLAPHQFHLPKYLGKQGWVGLWLDVPDTNWSAVELALREAWYQAAPKRLRTPAPQHGKRR